MSNKKEEKMLTEQIIQTIKQNPILYDKTIRPYRRDLRDALWADIADTFNLDVNILKVKWSNIKDCYKKHIRAQENNAKPGTAYKSWCWSKHLEFMRPYMRSNIESIYFVDTSENNTAKEQSENIHIESELETTATTLNVEPSAHNSGSDSDDVQFIEASIRNKILPKLTKKRQTSAVESNDDNLDDLDVHVHGFDSTELIFLGYAKAVKKMPLKRQICVKMKIAKILMVEELKSFE